MTISNINTKEEIEISIVMATYRTPPQFLSASIDSILIQSFKNFEFIIVCDGELEVFLSLKKIIDDRVRLVFNEKNMGLSYSLNKAISLSIGKYIFRMDADDISLPNRLSIQRNFLMKGHPIVSSLCYEIDSKDEVVSKSKRFLLHNIIARFLLYNTRSYNPVVHSSVAADRTVFDQNSYNEKLEFAQDYELWKRIKKEYKIFFIPKYLIKYRISGVVNNYKSNYQKKIMKSIK